MSLSITSPSFAHNGPIPSKFTCEGQDVSPALAWSGVPNGTKSLVLIVDDPDAPDPAAPKMTWVLIGIPTVRFGEIAEKMESLAAIEGVVLESTSNDGDKN